MLKLKIVSPEKIFARIGPKMINNWVSYITDEKPIQGFILKVSPKAKETDYIKRSILNFSGLKDKELRECIHNGNGEPYIPGSSIKGAIKTAVLAHYTQNKHWENDITDFKGRVDAKKVETKVFSSAVNPGDAPISDYFKYIKVGDANFEKNCEIASMAINLNIRFSKDNLVDNSKSQLTEAIATESVSEFNLIIDKAKSDFATAYKSTVRISEIPDEISSVSNLFKMINAHTISLIEGEISYWTNVKKEGAESYVENLTDILSTATETDSKSCVLRIGYGSGWRFMTGAWPEQLKNFESVVVPASRRNNEYYSQYDFPKSRRIMDDSDIFGFVKLTLMK